METMGAAYPELGRERDAILRWVTAEEQGFGRTLETGLTMLDELLARGEVSGEDAFKLHDTFGFPIDLTVEIAAEREVPVDIADFDARMEEQRLRSSAGAWHPRARRGQAGGHPPAVGGADGVHGLRALGGAHDRRRRPGAGWAHVREARELAVLRPGRWAGLRYGHDRVRGRRLPRDGQRGAALRRGSGRCPRGRDRNAEGGGEGRRARRPRRPSSHTGQPHRHAPAARRAARGAWYARAPGRLLRRARQAAL